MDRSDYDRIAQGLSAAQVVGPAHNVTADDDYTCCYVHLLHRSSIRNQQGEHTGILYTYLQSVSMACKCAVSDRTVTSIRRTANQRKNHSHLLRSVQARFAL